VLGRTKTGRTRRLTLGATTAKLIDEHVADELDALLNGAQTLTAERTISRETPDVRQSVSCTLGEAPATDAPPGSDERMTCDVAVG